MARSRQAPYGSWTSPISASFLVGALRLQDPTADRHSVSWAEGRPRQGGRTAVVRRTSDGKVTDWVRAPWNVRTRVHEYGGKAYLADGEALFFSEFSDQRIYHLVPGEEPRPVTAPGPFRYADFTLDGRRSRLIVVREDHSDEEDVKNSVAAIDLSGGGHGRILAGGEDFYASPSLSPDGRLLAWLSWNHPNMPWDGSRLWVGQISPDGGLTDVHTVAGGDGESVFQPEWGPGGELTFVSDRTGWWNLYCFAGGKTEALWPLQAEFGVPQWALGMSTYTWHGKSTLLCAFTQNGTWRLGKLDVHKKTKEVIDLPYTAISGVRPSPAGAVFVAASPTEPPSIVSFDAATGAHQVLRQAFSKAAAEGSISIPTAIEFHTTDGQTAHAFYYRPENRAYTPPPGARPPLLVVAHGGPTGSATSSLSLGVQYWTSRGWAVLDVNYRGSSGYGRAFRERLKGAWGIADVADCGAAAAHLIQAGEVDPERVAIRGGSAGGFTTLAALAFLETFKAGASYYGVSDCSALARDTHKFESRYLDGLIGPWPESEATYRARSPLEHAENLSCPVIFFQGLDDKVVPPNQAEMMAGVLRRQGIPVAYLTFPGEGHGFRKEESITRAQEAELYFYARIFGFALSDPVPEIAIDNLPLP